MVTQLRQKQITLVTASLIQTFGACHRLSAGELDLTSINDGFLQVSSNKSEKFRLSRNRVPGSEVLSISYPATFLTAYDDWIVFEIYDFP